MDSLYQEDFFKSSKPAPQGQALQETAHTGNSIQDVSEDLDPLSQFHLFFRLLKEDVEAQFPHCPHVQYTLQQLETAHASSQQVDFLSLLELLEEFLNLEYAKTAFL